MDEFVLGVTSRHAKALASSRFAGDDGLRGSGAFVARLAAEGRSGDITRRPHRRHGGRRGPLLHRRASFDDVARGPRPRRGRAARAGAFSSAVAPARSPSLSRTIMSPSSGPGSPRRSSSTSTSAGRTPSGERPGTASGTRRRTGSSGSRPRACGSPARSSSRPRPVSRGGTHREPRSRADGAGSMGDRGASAASIAHDCGRCPLGAPPSRSPCRLHDSSGLELALKRRGPAPLSGGAGLMWGGDTRRDCAAVRVKSWGLALPQRPVSRGDRQERGRNRRAPAACAVGI